MTGSMPKSKAASTHGRDPKRTSYGSFCFFTDPDGNAWMVQEVTTRLPGRVDGSVSPGDFH
jgi:hypothetical protein